FMPIVVEAVPPDQFAAWQTQQLASAAASRAAATAAAATTLAFDDLKRRGEQVYNTNCVPCHQANGLGVPGAFPALDGSAIVNGAKAAHINRVFNGKPGTPMPAFGSQLSDLEIAAVITFERNSWHNKVAPPDNLVQPAEVAALRKP
ncbi:MAG TPA: c-type cytochrome, partial [Rhodocyclaceae bacterium]|nr:c-type cytochrome [Rhodocyclaceae bacterium]